MIYEQIGRTFVAWNTITPANQAENEEQTMFMNRKIKAFGLFLCEKSKKPSYNPNQAENEEQTTFMNKKVKDFGLFLCEKTKKPSYIPNQPENEQQTTFMNVSTIMYKDHEWIKDPKNPLGDV